MPQFNDTTITGKVTQSAAASNPNDLIRKGEVDAALALKLSASDPSTTNSRAPTGAAGGDLAGTYPSPTLADVGTPGEYTKVTTDSNGRVISGTTLNGADVPAHALIHMAGGADAIRLHELELPTASVALNGQRLTLVQNPTAAQDAATKNYVDLRRLDQAALPTGPVDFNVQRAMKMADPIAASDAATKNYVDTRTPHDLALATTSLDLNNQKIINLAEPTLAQDAATKAYVDAKAQGSLIKESCRLATTANIALSGLAAIDGVVPAAGNRILVKQQTAGEQNGIYVASAGAWARAADADTSEEVQSGMFVFVSEGTINANNGFTLTTPNPIVLGTTVLTFTQTSGAGQITAGAGLIKTGNTIAADFGTVAGKTAEGNDARFTDARQMAPATADINANTHKVINVVDPTAAQDAATKNYVDTRKVHDFTAPSAPLAMNAQKITGVADPTAAQDAATKNYVDTRKLHDFTVATAPVDLNFQKIINLADPTVAFDAATKNYVDDALRALPTKAAVRCATTGSLVALSGLATIDGVLQNVGDRTLVKDQMDPIQNGIYIAASGAWIRSLDADGTSEIKAGMEVFVSEGTVNGDNEFRLTTNDPITLGVTPLTFAQMTGAGGIIAGAGLTKSGNTISIDFTTKWTDFAVPTGVVNFNAQKASSVADPALAQDAATKNYVDTRKVHDFTAPTAPLAMNAQKITGVADPTAAQDAVTKNYADNQHKTSNVAWVDKFNGDDATGARGRSDLPFLAITAAITAALPGDTIMVRPGTYFEKVTLKDAVNLHFLNGARIEDPGSSTAIFNDGSGAVTCKITGYGEFIGTGDGGVLGIGANSTVHLEGIRMESEATCITVAAGNVVVKADVVRSGSNRGVWLSGGVADITARQIQGGTAGCWLSGTGSYNIRGDLIKAVGGAGKGIYILDGNITAITAREITASNHYAVHCDMGAAPAQVTINGARISSTLTTAAGIPVFLTGTHAASAELILNRCTLVANTAGTPATVSIDGTVAATNVRFYGCVANLAAGANINNLLSAAQFEVDPDVK